MFKKKEIMNKKKKMFRMICNKITIERIARKLKIRRRIA